MQAFERKKTVTVSPEVHRRIVALRRGNQTFGDVIAESIRALEEKQAGPDIPCFDDLDLDAHIREADAAERDFEKNYVSIEHAARRYEIEHRDA